MQRCPHRSNPWSTSRWAIVVALATGACFNDNGGSTLDLTSAATGDDETTTDVVPTTGGSGPGTTTGGTNSGTTGTTGDPGSGPTGDPGPGPTGDPGSGPTGDPGSGSTGDPGSGSSSTGTTPGDPAIELQCYELFEIGAVASQTLCACYVEAGDYPDQASCLEKNLHEKSYIDCVCSVYAKYPESKADLDCNTMVLQNYNTCVASAGCDQGLLDECATPMPSCRPSLEATSDELVQKCMVGMP